MKKNIFKSRTFWFNVLSGVATFTGIIPLDPVTASIIVNVVNIGLRLITTEPVVVLPDKK